MSKSHIYGVQTHLNGVDTFYKRVFDTYINGVTTHSISVSLTHINGVKTHFKLRKHIFIYILIYIWQRHCTSKSLLHCSVVSRSGARASAAPPSTGCGNSSGSCNLNCRLLARPAFCLLRHLDLRFGRRGHLRVQPFLCQPFLCLPSPRTQK